MQKHKFFKLLVFLLLLIIGVGGYFFLNSIIGDARKFGDIKKIFNNEQRQIIKIFVPFLK